MPQRFARRWLKFDDSRPQRSRLARRFAFAVLTMLAVAGLLALLTAR